MSRAKQMTEEQKQKFRATLSDWQLTIKTYSTMNALHTLAQHWVENELIIEQAAKDEVERNGPKWEPKDEQEIGELLAERGVARMMHDDIMYPMHRYSCIVMLYTTVERELRRLIENLEKEHGPQKLQVNDIREKSYVAQVAKFVEVFRGVRLADCPQYEALSDLQKIRNCIIHCRGEVELSRDKEFLVQLWLGAKRRRGIAVPQNHDIHIYPECIEQFLKEVWNFFVWVFEKLNWKISAHWQGDKFEQTFKKLKK